MYYEKSDPDPNPGTLFPPRRIVVRLQFDLQFQLQLLNVLRTRRESDDTTVRLRYSVDRTRITHRSRAAHGNAAASL